MLVTIFFLSVGIIGVLIAVQQATAYVDNSFYRLTAIYLAQEGIETVRNIRDGNWLKGTECAPGEIWDCGLGIGDFEADYDDTSLSPWADRNLKIDGDFYGYSGAGTQTTFKRKITISDKQNLDGDPLNTADQMKVTVTVSWESKGQHSVSAEEYLYNWRE